jgi:hypothetical protein
MGVAQELSRHIRAHDLPDPFKTREVYRRHWHGLDLPEKAKPALDVLEDAGWIRPLELGHASGRPSEAWVINPEVYAHGK